MICFRCSQTISEEKTTVSGLHESCFLDWFKLKERSHFTDVAAKEISTGKEPFLELNGSFFHGKFKKYSAVLDGKCYILKVQEEDFPELPVTEYLCNQLARYLGLLVPDFYLIRFEEAVETFVSQNFMPKQPSSNLIHIYHFLKSSEDFNCQSILDIIRTQTQRLEDMERFIELTLFDALIGNHDRHGGNLGMIESPKGLYLAPFYDNPSYLGTEIETLLSAQHEPRGQIFTAESKEPKMRDYVKEWLRLGYGEIVERFRQKIEINTLVALVENSFLSLKRKEAFKKLITNRYLELMNEP
ncbi:MAG TPA: HipA family kinase [Rhabdochlamydiaceae bacterium]